MENMHTNVRGNNHQLTQLLIVKHTDVRINDYFSSENIAFALYKKVTVSKLFSW